MRKVRFGYVENVIGGNMRKVKCIKELPFCKIGEEFEMLHGLYCNFNNNHCAAKKGTNWFPVDVLIKDGWLEWVEEEKSLEEELHSELYQHIGTSGCHLVARIARKHENKRYLKVLDKLILDKYRLNAQDIRQAIEKAGGEE